MSRFVLIAPEGFAEGSDLQNRYISYLQTSQYVNDITSCINSNSRQYIDTMKYVGGEMTQKLTGAMRQFSADQVNAIKESTNAIVGSLDKGFNQVTECLDKGFKEINYNLVSINNEISELRYDVQNLAGLIDMRLNAIYEQQRITNLALAKIFEAMKIPDFQKERIYYFEQGMKYLKNAQIDKRRYADALVNFIEAEKREKRDYLILYNIGLIHLYSPEHLDLVKAEEYFYKASDYADDEIPENAQKSINYQNMEDFDTAFVIKTASQAYQNLAYSQYIQGKFKEAVQSAETAFSISNLSKEALYIAAHCYIHLKQNDKATECLEKISVNDFNYVIDAAFDPELSLSSDVRTFILDYKNNLKSSVTKKVDSLLSISAPGSKFADKANKLKSLVNKDNLIDIISAAQKIG